MENKFDKIIDRKGTNCIKWDFLKETYGRDDLIPLWVADMDFEAPDKVVEEIVKKAKHGVYGYTGMKESYFNSIGEWMNKRHGFEIKNEWIKTVPGVVCALSVAVNTFTNSGDKVLIQTPVYPPFYRVVESNGRKIVENSLVEKDGYYTMDFEALGEALREVKMMILCSPHNPIGRVWKRDELLKVAELCIKNDVILVSDEIHSDIVFKGEKHIPIASLNEEIKSRTISCYAPSKTFNVAGLSTSAVIIPNDKLREMYSKTIERVEIGGVNLFGITALEACYKNGEEWLKDLLEYLEGNADFVVQFISKNIPKVKVIKPEGTYLMWLDFRGTGLSHKEINDIITNKAKVALNSGVNFGKAGNGYMRLNIGCPRSVLSEALKRIKDALN